MSPSNTKNLGNTISLGIGIVEKIFCSNDTLKNLDIDDESKDELIEIMGNKDTKDPNDIKVLKDFKKEIKENTLDYNYTIINES